MSHQYYNDLGAYNMIYCPFCERLDSQRFFQGRRKFTRHLEDNHARITCLYCVGDAQCGNEEHQCQQTFAGLSDFGKHLTESHFGFRHGDGEELDGDGKLEEDDGKVRMVWKCPYDGCVRYGEEEGDVDEFVRHICTLHSQLLKT